MSTLSPSGPLGEERDRVLHQGIDFHITVVHCPKFAWGKKAPALTVSQVRALLVVILPLRTYTVADVLELVAWVQRCNHRAYLSHRRRREAEGKSESFS